MAGEPSSREHMYARIKDAVTRGEYRREARIDLQALADRHRVSVTPVREILYELIGERLVEPHPFGGFQVVTLDAIGLAHLYAWNAQHLLAVLHLLPEPVIRPAIQAFAGGLERASGDPVALVERIFAALTAAGGNSEFDRQADAANDRLRRARLAEGQLFPDQFRELRSLVRSNGFDVRNNVRRRLIAYHRRRVEHAPQIAALQV